MCKAFGNLIFYYHNLDFAALLVIKERHSFPNFEAISVGFLLYIWDITIVFGKVSTNYFINRYNSFSK